MVEYLESVHMVNLSQEHSRCKKDLDVAELDDKYRNPTETLPIPTSPQCKQNECGECKSVML